MSHFFAYLARMKFIQRWGLMRNTQPENIQEHSLQVAMIAHALALIKNKFFAGAVDPERTAILAMFHDAGEVITGDLAAPIKYFNPQIKAAYGEIERVANQRLYQMLPEELKPDYYPLFFHQAEDGEQWELVKAADKISAYLKCVEEIKAGNQEFIQAEKALRATIAELDLPEVAYFMEKYGPSMALTLDELN